LHHGLSSVTFSFYEMAGYEDGMSKASQKLADESWGALLTKLGIGLSECLKVLENYRHEKEAFTEAIKRLNNPDSAARIISSLKFTRAVRYSVRQVQECLNDAEFAPDQRVETTAELGDRTLQERRQVWMNKGKLWNMGCTSQCLANTFTRENDPPTSMTRLHGDLKDSGLKLVLKTSMTQIPLTGT
jgi:hypothetical protein